MDTVERQTREAKRGAKLAKERLFGDEGSNHLRKQMIKARFLQNLPSPTCIGDGGDETSDHGGGSTEPGAGEPSIDPVCIGRFKVLRKLGQGGMGVVYAAYDEQLDRRIALKLLHGDLSKDEHGRARMQREAQALARLSHPNVVQVHEIGQWRDHDYVAMEFVAGQTLQGWLDNEQRSWGQILEMMMQAGRGLAAAHAARLVHRDFKPANLLVGEDGRPRVLDFGLAREVGCVDLDTPDPDRRAPELFETGEHTLDRSPGEGSNSSRTTSSSAFDQLLTATGAMLGTPAYMAPEQHRGERATELSDQFSFCLVLYEALFGQRPYQAKSRREYAGRVRDGDFIVPGPSSGVPKWLRLAVCRGLAPQPAERWVSMEALLAELGRDRARTWRRVAVAAGLMASIGLGVALNRTQPSSVGVCEYDRSVVADSWGEPQRVSMRAAFEATKLDGFTPMFEQTARALDAYADQLVAARTDACAQRWIEKLQTDEQLALRISCLEQRESELAAVVGVFATADQRVVLRAPELVRGLGVIDMCARVDLLERNTPVPKDDVTAAAIVVARRDIAVAEASSRAGRIEAATKLIADLERRATDLGYGPLLAEVAYLQGVHHVSERDLAAALASFTQALRQAELSGDAELSWRAQIRIAQLSEHADPRSSLEFMLAEVGVTLLGDRPSDRYSLHEARGRAFAGMGRLEDALVDYDEAVKIAEAGFLGSEHALAGALRARSSIAALVGSDEQARVDLLRALSLHTRLGAANVNILEATYDLAIVELEQEDYASAELHFREAIANYEQVYGSGFVNIGHANLGLAEVARTRGQFDDAELRCAQALQILDVDHDDHAYALDMLASIKLQREAFSVAVGMLERALSHTQATAPNSTMELGYRHGRLGHALALHGQHERALVELDAAIELLKSDLPTLETVTPLVDRGAVQLALGEPQLALVSFERAVELTELTDARPTLSAEARLGLATAARDLGDHARQRQLAAEVERSLRDTPESDELLERAKELQRT